MFGGLSFIALYLFVAISRVNYPFELEWTEGGAVNQVIRILSGQNIYCSPTIEFVPYIYTPLYYYVSALAAKLIGIGFLPLRLVSFFSSISTFVVIGLLVYRETRNLEAAALATSLFAATFLHGGAWFDLARVDSLFIFFLLTAFYVIRFHSSRKSLVIAGILSSLAFLTKQTTLIMIAPILIYAAYAYGRRSAYFIATLLILVAGSWYSLDYLTDGWFDYYVFNLPAHHPIAKSWVILFWLRDILLTLPVACLASALYLFNEFKGPDKQRGLFYLLLTAGTLLGAWSSRAHEGGYNNVVIPAYAALAILLGLYFGLTIGSFRNIRLPNPFNRKNSVLVITYLAFILQLSFLAYNPFDQIPTAQDLESGNRLIKLMASFDGEVFLPTHGYLPSLAGKTTFAPEAAITDVLRAGDGPIARRLVGELDHAFRSGRFAAVILDMEPHYRFSGKSAFSLRYPWLAADIANQYNLRDIYDINQDVFFPVTGLKIRPQYLLTPNMKQDVLPLTGP